MMVLAGDIGGTRTRLMLASLSAGTCQAVCVAEYENQAYADFYLLLENFLAQTAIKTVKTTRIEGICLAVAGPLEQLPGQLQRVQMTNLAWTIDTSTLREKFSLPYAVLINDFAAQVYGLEQVSATDLLTLQAGDIPAVPLVRAFIGAGTGLGMAIAARHTVAAEQPWLVLPSQGGHTDFAPVTATQLWLWQLMQARYGRVSNECLLSGNGLLRIYEALCATDDQPALFRQPAELTRAALEHSDPGAVLAVEEFVRIYGAVAGNLALLCLPSGGLYITGGIAPKIVPFLQEGHFLQAFNNKPPYRALLEKIPVYLVLNQQLGLLGAAEYLRMQLDSGQ